MTVTIEQLAEITNNLFKQIDTNKDGRIEKEELRQFAMIVQKTLNETYDEIKFEEDFKKMDKNGDGTISITELFESLFRAAKKNGELAENYELMV